MQYDDDDNTLSHVLLNACSAMRVTECQRRSACVLNDFYFQIKNSSFFRPPKRSFYRTFVSMRCSRCDAAALRAHGITLSALRIQMLSRLSLGIKEVIRQCAHAMQHTQNLPVFRDSSLFMIAFQCGFCRDFAKGPTKCSSEVALSSENTLIADDGT
jgi:hypothetical protein